MGYPSCTKGAGREGHERAADDAGDHGDHGGGVPQQVPPGGGRALAGHGAGRVVVAGEQEPVGRVRAEPPGSSGGCG